MRLLRVGDVVLERFVVEHAPHRQLPTGRDRASGSAIVFLGPVDLALDRVALRCVARLDLGADDPRIARTLACDPVIVGYDVERALAPAVAADALIAMLELSAALAPRGMKPEVFLARVPEDGSSDVRVPVVPAYGGMHFFMREQHRWDLFWGLAAWARGHGVAGPEPSLAGPSLRDFGRAIASLASDPDDALRRVDALPDRLQYGPLAFDLDEAIAECERDLAAAREPSWERECLVGGLAAALHRRACICASRSDAWSVDLERAIALDPHPSYLTTQALLRERESDPRAAESHDAAVDALSWSVPPETEPMIWSRPADPPERAHRDAARTLTARAAYRVRHGDRDGAREDLERAASYRATPQVRRWIAFLDR